MKVVNLILLVLFATPAFALPEGEVQADYATVLKPFLREKLAKVFTFNSDDGLPLSAVYIDNPTSTKTVLVVNGRTESWLKYAEVFYDLYQKGYSIYSYDHRGQGLSPHLSNVSSEIGHVEHFHYYLEDLNTFVTKVILPNRKPNNDLFILSHSLGGTVVSGYLSEYTHPFKKAVLSSPMLEINTKPYSELEARAIVTAMILIGQGQHYAKGQKDANIDAPLSSSTTTESASRWWLTNEVFRENPTTILGGPSNRWVFESIKATHSIRNEMDKISIPILMFQSGQDQIVNLGGENDGCAAIGKLCTMVKFPDSQHEILFERDSIRMPAMDQIISFLE